MVMGEIPSLYSRAWDNYAFLTYVARDPVSHDRAYWRLLNPRANVSFSGRSNNDQSAPYVEQMLPRARAPHGPSRLGFREQVPLSSDDVGLSTSSFAT